jgi:fructose-bisphosphate aldolase class II
MTVETLRDVLHPALEGGYAVAGLVCLGWEDARAYAMAAEDEGLPVILQAGPGARAHMPIPVWGAMLRQLAEEVDVPVVIHLDHGKSVDEARAAIEAGFTSIMYDGSLDPLDKNIADTARIAEMAHAAGISCEGELGVVGYHGGAASRGTDPEDAARFVAETGIDALAISVGNVHLQTEAAQGLDRARIDAIAARTSLPLVIHGGSGVPPEERRRLARETPICKFNIGTELRQVFGQALRARLAQDPDIFDRIAILGGIEPDLRGAARAVLRGLAG